MTADSAALLTLGLLACLFAAVVARQIAACGSVSVWFVSRFIRTYCMLGVSQRIHGRSPLPSSGGALLVANHRSPADPLVLYSASLPKEEGFCMRPIEFLTASEYCGHGGFVGWIMRTARCIPVARDGQDMGPAKEALRRLQRGCIVGIFPEGGIHFGGGLGKFNPGVAWLALRGNVPVIPAIVRNTPYAEPLLRSFLIRQPADAVFGPPVDLTRWQNQRLTSDVLVEVAEHLRTVMLRMLAEAD